MHTVIVLGHTGLLGTQVAQHLTQQGYTVIGKSINADGFDITKESEITKLIATHTPLAIVNCTAFTNVEACEDTDGFEQARILNGTAPTELVRMCKENNVHVVHVSTDYVFNENSEDGYTEDQVPQEPMNAYGETKLLGERGITDVMGGIQGSSFNIQEPRAYIVRTQWLFGEGAQNFIAKITARAKEYDHIDVVDDEYGCPTSVTYVAECIAYVLQNLPDGGIYHAISSNSCSRFEFAQEILALQKITTPVHRATLNTFKRKAHIAHYSILKNTKFPNQPTWQEMLKNFFESHHAD